MKRTRLHRCTALVFILSTLPLRILAAATGEEAHASNMVARSYIRYYDANGLYRTYYNNYTGNARIGGGCITSYNTVLALEAGQ